MAHAAQIDHPQPDNQPAPTGCPAALDPRIERSRQAVLDAALALMHDEGPDTITHVRVAGAARVSRTTVYKHFPTRSDLLRATLDHFGKPTPVVSTGDLFADLIRLFSLLVDDLLDDDRARLFITMLSRAEHDAVVAEVRDEFMDEFRNEFRALVADGIDTGVIDADTDADMTLAAIIGLHLVYRFMFNDPISHDRLGDVVRANFRWRTPPA